MAMVNTTRAAPPTEAKASFQASSPGAQAAEVIAASRPPGGSMAKAARRWRRSASRRGAGDAGGRREGWVHQHRGGAHGRQEVGDALGVVAGDGGLGEQAGKQPGAGRSDLVEMQLSGGVARKCACGHDGEHAGAGGGLQHDLAGPDGGGPQDGIRERQRGRELLQADLRFGAPGVRGLQRRDHLQHRQHPARTARTGAGLAAHGPSVALHEQHDGGFGRLIGVLPQPGARGVARPEGAGHGLAQGGGIERPAGFERGQQDPGGGEQRVRAGTAFGRRRSIRHGGVRCGGRARGRVRRGWASSMGGLRLDGCGSGRTASGGSSRAAPSGLSEGRPARLPAAARGPALRVRGRSLRPWRGRSRPAPGSPRGEGRRCRRPGRRAG